MNLLHLHYFYVVAKEQGFTRASRTLRIAQPAISRMVKLLEEDFGFALFERIGRNVQLTRQGLEVFENCKKIFAEVDQLKSSLDHIKGECKGPLALAAAEPIASHFIPSCLVSFLGQNEKVYPQIFSGPSSMLFERILNGELEFGLFFHIPSLPERLEMKVLRQSRFHLVIKKELRRNKKVLRSFIGSREIDDVDNRRFPTVERMRQEDPEVKIKISSNNLTAHREMVLAGLGVSILPDFLVASEIEAGRLADVYTNEKFEFSMKVVYRKSGVLSLNARSFLQHCTLA